MRVPFLDLVAHHAPLRDELRHAVGEVIDSAAFILGPAVERFERAFAEYVGTRHCVGLNNGTSALHMALVAAGVGPGDEVITTPHTWISTSWAISYVGAKPVYVDIDPETFNLNPTAVKAAITPRTRALLPVHLYGQTADLGELSRIAAQHHLMLIEDAAQAHGARFEGRRVGSVGNFGCFSFYPGKNLGAFGEAGAVTTDDDEAATRIRRLRDHAQSGRHHHAEIGFNTRMEGVQAAALAVKLQRLDPANAARRRHAKHYAELLADVEGLRLPSCRTEDGHVWHLYVVQFEQGDRQSVVDRLTQLGISTAIHYPTPVPFQPAYAHLGYRAGDFPVAERVMRNCLSLPMYPELSSAQIEYVAASLKSILSQTRKTRAA